MAFFLFHRVLRLQEIMKIQDPEVQEHLQAGGHIACLPGVDRYARLNDGRLWWFDRWSGVPTSPVTGADLELCDWRVMSYEEEVSLSKLLHFRGRTNDART